MIRGLILGLFQVVDIKPHFQSVSLLKGIHLTQTCIKNSKRAVI